MHPKSSAVLTVIRNFESVRQLAKGPGHLDFHEGVVRPDRAYGTPHCHGGWYEVATTKKRSMVERLLVKVGLFQERISNFQYGMSKMADTLGFSCGQALKQWAHDNPDIWGNPHGYYMFHGEGEIAFTGSKRPKGAQTLQDIIDHWKEVYDRLVVLESKKESVEISNPPITAETLVESLEGQSLELVES